MKSSEGKVEAAEVMYWETQGSLIIYPFFLALLSQHMRCSQQSSHHTASTRRQAVYVAYVYAYVSAAHTRSSPVFSTLKAWPLLPRAGINNRSRSSYYLSGLLHVGTNVTHTYVCVCTYRYTYIETYLYTCVCIHGYEQMNFMGVQSGLSRHTSLLLLLISQRC